MNSMKGWISLYIILFFVCSIMCLFSTAGAAAAGKQSVASKMKGIGAFSWAPEVSDSELVLITPLVQIRDAANGSQKPIKIRPGADKISVLTVLFSAKIERKNISLFQVELLLFPE